MVGFPLVAFSPSSAKKYVWLSSSQGTEYLKQFALLQRLAAAQTFVGSKGYIEAELGAI